VSYSTIETLSRNARVVLYRLQAVHGNALYVIPSLISPDDRDALAELSAAGLAQIRDVQVGIIARPQAILTAAGRARVVADPWNPWGVAS
jgi:hypothetical protein